MKIGIIQKIRELDTRANVDGLKEMIRECARQGAGLIVLPRSPY
ncbi:MAG: hypothetical protein PHG96_05095 [Kiritimatiellae bacterium]|nr:hypothetical protein [Kiritimatiellia bacterium]MDD4019713.1 hypothetical protein [Kiritimatiellia bacterium]